MQTNRRNFFKLAGIAGSGILTANLASCTTIKDEKPLSGILNAVKESHVQRFNMSGYAAPKLETVRIGIIGLGSRGLSALNRLKRIDGVEIRALCDKKEDQVEKAQNVLKDFGLPSATTYAGNEEIWSELVLRDDLDLVYIATPASLHARMSIMSMEENKHVATEVPAAITVEDCWKLVETSEKTRKHCMMLENCCYDFFELLTLNLSRQGFFGEIVHGEGAYIHYMQKSPGSIPIPESTQWRMLDWKGRIGNTYPTHGLGPICQIMDINRGDSMDYLVSMSSNDFIRSKWNEERAKEEEFYKQFLGVPQNGNMNTTTIKTKKGRTIMVQYDTSSPRVYSRIHLISGTKGCAQKYPLPGKISIGDAWLNEEEIKSLEEKYLPEIVRHIGDAARKVGGHGGMDFIMDWRLIDCLRNGLPLDQDVYDAALWSVIGPLSEWSVANRSDSIDVPDFTCGAYKNNQPVDITLKRGNTTGLRAMKK